MLPHMSRHRRLRDLSDAELLEETIDAVVAALTTPSHVYLPAGRLDHLATERARRQRKHRRTGASCTCWLCFPAPEHESIHDPVTGPF